MELLPILPDFGPRGLRLRGKLCGMSNGTTNRVKKSYSISVEAEQYVRRYRRAKKIASDSEALDSLLRAALAAEKLASVEAAYKTHYDDATEEDIREEQSWGELGAKALQAVEWNA